jgi:hypothetical protein
MSSLRSLASPGLRLSLAAALLAGGAAAQETLYGFTGNDVWDYVGSSVEPAGDVNGDGTLDVLVSGYNAGPGQTQFGSVWVLSGKSGAVLRTWSGAEALARFGCAVCSVGDIDKDGGADILIGSNYSDVNGNASGRISLFSGKTGALIREVLNAQAGSGLGTDVCGLGDLDGDGWPDYAASMPYYKDAGVQVGRVQVWSGKTGSTITTLTGTGEFDLFGLSIGDAGDVNGDGKHDLIIAEPDAPNHGRVQVRSGSNLAMSLITKTGMGSDVSGAGDVNGDGLADVIAGSAWDGLGHARIFLGPSGAASWEFAADASLDGFGAAVAPAGDIDKDGFDDVIVGAYQTPFSATLKGYARVFSGRTGTVLYQTMDGAQGGECYGVAVAGLGDVDGDGWADIGVGAYNWDSATGADVGRVEVRSVLKHATNLGFGGPGNAALEMHGSPLDDFGQMDLRLTGAKGNAQAWLLASAGQQLVAFKGGVLVPDITTALLVPFVTTPAGNVLVPGILGGFGPVTIRMQFVIKDAAQPHGFAMSNAIAASFLP